MEILILKNGEIFARTSAEEGSIEDYSMVVVNEIPEYPTEAPTEGYYWELTYVDGVVEWQQVPYNLNSTEVMEILLGGNE